MKITYFGTTMLLFDDGKDQILFDCHLTRPSLLKCGLGSLKTNKTFVKEIIKEYEIDRLKGIFISHTHHDHVMDMPYFANKCDADIYGSASCVNVALGGKVNKHKCHSYDDKMKYRIGDFKIEIIPSIHSIAHWYNNDLGQTIDEPLKQPAKKKEYKEGGSFDFLVTYQDTKYLIRPSYNFKKHQLDDIRCDVLFLGVGGLSKDSKKRVETFFKETVEKVKPHTIIPVHWDNFFVPLTSDVKPSSGMIDNGEKSLSTLEEYCKKHDINYILQKPLTEIEL